MTAKQRAEGVDNDFKREGEWNGIKTGDEVKIKDPTGEYLKGHWKFQYLVTNTRNGLTSVEVIGGKKGQNMTRAFKEERVSPA